MIQPAILNKISDLVLQELAAKGHQIAPGGPYAVPLGISARHVHLSPEDLERLFGKGYQLKPFKPLSQPGQYAAEEMVTLVGPRGTLAKVRILGPVRSRTQIEVAASDARALGVIAPVRGSGNTAGTPGIGIIGPEGRIDVPEGVIIADRHIHMTPDDARRFGVTEGEQVRIVVPSLRGGVLNRVTIRIHPDYALDCHVDTDDANAFMLQQGQKLAFIKNWDNLGG